MEWIEVEYERYCSDPDRPRDYHDVYEYFADWCATFRKTYGLTQKALAEMLDTTTVTISNWENFSFEALPSPENQRRLKQLERELWLEENWSDGLAELDTPATIGIKALIRNFEDKAAQAQAEYLIEVLGPHLPEANKVHLTHLASLTHAVPSSQSADKGRQYAEEAFAAARELDMNGPSARLATAIRNELLGYQNDQIMKLPHGKARRAQAVGVIGECFKLFRNSQKTGRKETIILWNGLECACTNQLSEQSIVPVLDALCAEEGEKKVAKRVMKNDIYEAARPYLSRMTDPALKN